MTDQLEMFPPRRARKGDPWTSHAARRGSSLTADILAAFKNCAPMTDEELCALFPTKNSGSVKTARSRLAGEGFLEPTGECRKSQYGYWMQVWRLTFRRTENVVDSL